MNRRSVLVLVLSAFAVGVFFGIWVDWSTWRHKVGTRNLIYQVQDYQMANLQVAVGDSIFLMPPPGGDDSSLLMNFVGGPKYNPCQGSGAHPKGVNPCVITANAPAGPYFFTCSSNQGYSCPDPGIQQTPGGPLENLSYFEFVKTDFTSLIGLQSSSVSRPELQKRGSTHPAASAVTAYVSCSDQNSTVLQDLNGNSLQTIMAAKGQSVFWISPVPFSLDTSNFPPGLCSPSNPGDGSTQEAQCDVAQSPNTVQYKIQAQTTPTCSALQATLVTK